MPARQFPIEDHRDVDVDVAGALVISSCARAEEAERDGAVGNAALQAARGAAVSVMAVRLRLNPAA